MSNIKQINQVKYFIIQKLVGFTMSAIGTIAPCFVGDATISLFVIPLGVYMVFTREHVLDINV